MPNSNDRLDALLREREPALPDDGFTERVTAALPRARRIRARAGRWTLVGAGAAGGAFAASFGAPLQEVIAALPLVGGHSPIAVAVGLLVLVAAPVAWAFHVD